MKRISLCLAAILSIALLAGCTPAPTVLPDVVVVHEGTTEFETNEFIVAIRAKELAGELAWNSGDFTLTQLTETTSPDEITEVYEYYASLARQGFPPTVYSGPVIWAPISVTVNGDSAEIVACLATQGRAIEEGSEDTSYDLTATNATHLQRVLWSSTPPRHCPTKSTRATSAPRRVMGSSPHRHPSNKPILFH